MATFSEDQPASLMLRGLDKVEAFTNAHHKVELFRHPQLGHVLVINDEVQHVEAWAALYHEPLIHLPAAFCETPEKVIILGGGSLFAAAEALRYASVTQVILVDYDADVLKLMERHYGHAARCLSDARFKHVEADGLAFVRDCSDRYDLVINDCFDLLTADGGAPTHAALSQLASPQGVCADVTYRHVFEQGYARQTFAQLNLAGRVAAGLIFVPEYPGALHILATWGASEHIRQNAAAPVNAEQQAWARTGSPTEYFDAARLAHHLYLPPLVRRQIGPSNEVALES